jgi:hypothetical protein
MGLHIGKKAGIGHWGTTKVPGFLIVFLKKKLFIENMGPLINGSAF